mgnify:CR=1 FL=1
MRIQAQLWVIDCTNPGYGPNGWWTDNWGGNLFTSPAMAQRALEKHRKLLPHWAEIKPCRLDDDLAQMGNLYHEENNK